MEPGLSGDTVARSPDTRVVASARVTNNGLDDAQRMRKEHKGDVEGVFALV
ncbi:hypothetical protein [Sporisorium scitamineum]|uniref:Uncharacterized protein n=1 Tax=Sporisorium scitamineum TaxID=49012 RepID=A0A0F7S1E9_9BASI|nr:hypothetical protein [Sporisorium scitamineum]